MVATILVFAVSCSDDEEFILDDTDFPVKISEVLSSASVDLNPTGYAPLSAYIDLELLTRWEISSIGMRVAGQDGPESDVERMFDVTGTTQRLLILGLYGGYNNSVELTFYNPNGYPKADTTFMIRTMQDIGALPEITIDVPATADWNGQMTLVKYWGFLGNIFPQRPFIMDKWGKIRWYLVFDGHPMLDDTNYNNGLKRGENGNLFFATGNVFNANGGNNIYEVDMTGDILNTWPLGDDYPAHHDILEKPNGNFLVHVYDKNSATVEDLTFEVDRTSGAIVNVMDMKIALDQYRRAWWPDEVDWVHANGMWWDERDNTIIHSGRTQGVWKQDEDDNVKWIISTHNGWGMSGNGVDLNTKLLTPLDANGDPITDTVYTYGYQIHPDFDWPWYQHAPKVLPNGNLILFDNGTTRNYIIAGPQSYSRAVEYEIDEVNMTVKQVWEYGKERGTETFSRFVSDVDYLEGSNSIVFTPGGVQTSTSYGKVVEIDRSTGNVIYEATVTPPNAFFGLVTMHRSERLSLYPD
jgi:arylsulfate sulfotransferase